jgi:uncharacterized repeat protein (TIGR02543 family)
MNFNNKFKVTTFIALALILGACSPGGSSSGTEISSTTSTSIVDSNSSYSSEVSDERYQIYLKALSDGFTGSYQEWLDSIKGADGTSILSGNNDPTGDVGRNGDVYVNTTSWDFFVKAGGVWTKVGNIMGAKGEKGDQGEPGQAGMDGQTPFIGNNGNWWIGTTDTGISATGPAGENGTNGTNGTNGVDGQTPYIGTNGNWWIGTTDTGVSASVSISNTTYTVTFKPDNGQANFTQQVNQYHLVTKPSNPTKADHQFTGWFTDQDEQWVFSGYPLTQNLTLTAKYQIVENGTDGLLFTPTIYEGKQSYVVSGYEGTSKEIVIPSTFNNIEVVGVGKDAFSRKWEIENISFSSSIKFIGSSAFANIGLTSITLPNSVILIGDNAFRNNQLNTVIIPNSVIRIGDGAFLQNQLISLIISDKVTHIGSMAFYNNQLNTVIIPNSVTYIGNEAFAANQLTSLIIGDNVTHIADSAFARNRLSSVNIPYGLTHLDGFNDNLITSISIPNTVIYLGAYAFARNQLTSVVIPNSVIHLGGFASNQLTSVVIPNSVTYIDEEAFTYNQINSIIFPGSVTHIGAYSFSDNPIVTLFIPTSVAYIGEFAFTPFNYSNTLQTIYIERETIPQEWNQDWLSEEQFEVVEIIFGYTPN